MAQVAHMRVASPQVSSMIGASGRKCAFCGSFVIFRYSVLRIVIITT
jgi:hypothetical protein